MVAPTALYCTGAALRTGQDAVPAGHGRAESIVGYAQNTLLRGNKIIGAQFAPIGATAYDLTKIQVTGYSTTDGTEADVKVQKLDAFGRGGMTYSYYDVPNELTGWLNGNDEEVEVGTVTLTPGEGFWVSAPSTTFGLQTAGNVLRADIEMTLCRGNMIVVNTTPVAVDLRDILVKGYSAKDGTEADVKVQKLDSLGRGGMTYSYYDVPGELTGWLDGNDEEITADTVMIEPGEGVWVSAPSKDFSLVLPAPEF